MHISPVQARFVRRAIGVIFGLALVGGSLVPSTLSASGPTDLAARPTPTPTHQLGWAAQPTSTPTPTPKPFDFGIQRHGAPEPSPQRSG